MLVEGLVIEVGNDRLVEGLVIEVGNDTWMTVLTDVVVDVMGGVEIIVVAAAVISLKFSALITYV